MFWKLRNRFERFFFWLWSQKGSPAHRARGLAIGVFCGCFPLLGFQTLLGITLASLIRGNRLLAITGTWISNPITYVPLYWLNYYVGCLILDGDNTAFTALRIRPKEVYDLGWVVLTRFILGSSIVGITLALLLGSFVYIMLKYVAIEK